MPRIPLHCPGTITSSVTRTSRRWTMRNLLALTAALCLVLSGIAHAGPPVTANSTNVISGQGAPCQYRFRVDGGLDQLIVTTQLFDAVFVPVPAWPVTCQLVPNPGTLAFCTCCPNPQTGFTNAAGVIVFTFRKIGGRGTLDVFTNAAPAAWTSSITFTSPDLNGSCEPSPQSSTTVVDLGLWAQCLAPGPYCTWSDYNCSGTVDVVDLGLFAGGFQKGCAPPCP